MKQLWVMEIWRFEQPKVFNWHRVVSEDKDRVWWNAAETIHPKRIKTAKGEHWKHLEPREPGPLELYNLEV